MIKKIIFSFLFICFIAAINVIPIYFFDNQILKKSVIILNIFTSGGVLVSFGMIFDKLLSKKASIYYGIFLFFYGTVILIPFSSLDLAIDKIYSNCDSSKVDEIVNKISYIGHRLNSKYYLIDDFGESVFFKFNYTDDFISQSSSSENVSKCLTKEEDVELVKLRLYERFLTFIITFLCLALGINLISNGMSIDQNSSCVCKFSEIEIIDKIESLGNLVKFLTVICSFLIIGVLALILR